MEGGHPGASLEGTTYSLEIVQGVEGGFFGPFDDECAVFEAEVADHSLREVEWYEGDLVCFEVADHQSEMHGDGHAPA